MSDTAPGVFHGDGLVELAQRVARPVHLVARERDGALGLSERPRPAAVGTVPAMYPEWLGGRSFAETHQVRFPYVAGEMAYGIAGVEMVEAMAREEMLAFFGAAGLGLARLDRDLERLRTGLAGRRNWGVNLIHQPHDRAMENEVAARLLRAGVPKISVSAFMDITPAVVRCSGSGLRADAAGRIFRRTALFAKVSRPETAELFLSPPPAELVRRLVRDGELTEDEGRLAARTPVVDDITVEADSGGHTDGRPLVAVLPAVLALARRKNPGVRVGAAGGLGDPAAVAAAFALGAAYVVTGSVNQMSVEAAVSDEAKAMLAQAGVADVAMAPAADMFELGAKVQVLRRGTKFAGRAARLHQLYTAHPSLESIPKETRQALEREVFGTSLDDVWKLTEEYWSQRAPAEVTRAHADPKHRMALTFRWYLGNAAAWAVDGAPGRRFDYQLWCGPAAGAFNTWVAGSFLADPGRRSVTQIARNLLQGAAVLTRAHQLRTLGVRLPAEVFDFRPRPLA
ncbi:PfaD family polyunsaturated fatty acid/polyketide biosynthesis protein [Streptomyces sp. A1-5]|uniref:PfaD family polyunsaturated fatty acid/polyketide biosynthesis protein n=1 Tax=Streptomyces sp. A1-5 TaxID=2738410 RepID=UPI001F0071F4|nr:PfaD family polyunsaturated fatty acid/polyketide biosynthesis protein [Streptomyces sp. A1-5]